MGIIKKFVSKTHEKTLLPKSFTIFNHNFIKFSKGFCYMSKFSFNRVNCYQFDDLGNTVADHWVELDYEPGRWMTMQNLGQGEIILVTSQCHDDDWCHSNFNLVTFHVHKIGGRKKEEYQTFTGIDCNYAQDVRMDVTRAVETKNACVNFVCYVGGDDSYVNIFNKCVSSD